MEKGGFFLNNKVIFIMFLAISSIAVNVNAEQIKLVAKEQNKFEKYVSREGLNINGFNINQSKIDHIVNNTFLTELDIFKFLKRKVLLKNEIDCSKYSTLIAMAQSVKVNLSREELSTLENVSKDLNRMTSLS